MTKNEIKTAITNETTKLENGKSIYIESISTAMGLNPEYSGVIVTKDKNGEIKVCVDNGECYPATYSIEEFANIYGDDTNNVKVSFDELKDAFDLVEDKTSEFAAHLIDEYFPNAKNHNELIKELVG